MIGIGVFVAIYAANHYQVGEPARMGPGFFPVALGWILAGLGVIIVGLSFHTAHRVLVPPPFTPRTMLAVLGAIAVFGLLLTRFGLIPAAVALTFIAVLARPGFSFKRTLALAVSLAVLSWLIFTIGLQMTMPAFAD